MKIKDRAMQEDKKMIEDLQLFKDKPLTNSDIQRVKREFSQKFDVQIEKDLEEKLGLEDSITGSIVLALFGGFMREMYEYQSIHQVIFHETELEDSYVRNFVRQKLKIQYHYRFIAYLTTFIRKLAVFQLETFEKILDNDIDRKVLLDFKRVLDSLNKSISELLVYKVFLPDFGLASGFLKNKNI